MFVWDEKKRVVNLRKHKLDFADAEVIYDNPAKVTFFSHRKDESRAVDVAMVDFLGTILSLVYVQRAGDVRIISFRYASRKERRLYAEARESD